MDCTDASRGPEAHWRERQFADAQALAHVGSWERRLLEERGVWSDELCRIFGQPTGFSPSLAEFAALVPSVRWLDAAETLSRQPLLEPAAAAGGAIFEPEADDMDEMRGGSTITQQVAKNLFLWQGRSYVRKALEFPLALWIDLILPKRRILEIYLNIAEWGPNGEFGAEAGAQRAFGKSAQDLSRYEAALLAAALPNPANRNARQPASGLRRLAGLYVARAARSPAAAACLR